MCLPTFHARLRSESPNLTVIAISARPDVRSDVTSTDVTHDGLTRWFAREPIDGQTEGFVSRCVLSRSHSVVRWWHLMTDSLLYRLW